MLLQDEFFIKANFIKQKMDRKAGWSYVILPKKTNKSGLPFGWTIGKGSIDHFEIKQFNPALCIRTL